MSATRARLLARDEPVRLETPSTRASGFLHAGTYERRRAGHSGAAPSHGPAVSAPELNDRRRTILNQGRRAASPLPSAPVGGGSGRPHLDRGVGCEANGCPASHYDAGRRGAVSNSLVGPGTTSQRPKDQRCQRWQCGDGAPACVAHRRCGPQFRPGTEHHDRSGVWPGGASAAGGRSTRTPRSCKPAGRHCARNR
jgi:hypothetical protein